MSNPIEYRQAKADWQLAVSVAEGAMNYWGDVMSAIQAGKGAQAVAEESTTAEISEAEVVQEQPTTETPIETIAESEPTSEPQPIGSGAFGNIYDTFRGKAKEAFTFLMREKSGDALGVFYRDGVGDIDLVWGDTNGGLAHIISKHVGKDKSFSSVEDAQNEISDIIENGEIVFENGDKVVISKNNKIVTLRKNYREKGKKIADKNWILTAYDETKADGTSAISDTNQGQAAQPTTVFESEVSENVSDVQAGNGGVDVNTPISADVINGIEDIETLNGLLAEIDKQLRDVSESEAIREQARAINEQYGSLENAPADIQERITARWQANQANIRILYDNKYAIQDRIRAIEEAQAEAERQDAIAQEMARQATVYNGFLVGMSPMARGRAEKTLSKKKSYNGKVMTRAEFIEQGVADGREFSIGEWKGKTEYRVSADVGFYTITKLEYEYGKYLEQLRSERAEAQAEQGIETQEESASERKLRNARVKAEAAGADVERLNRFEQMPLTTLRKQARNYEAALRRITDDAVRAEYDYVRALIAEQERNKKNNKWGVKVGNSATDFATVRAMFEEWNSDEDVAALFDKVAPIFEKLPVTILFSDTIGGKGTQGIYKAAKGELKLPGHFVYSDTMSNQEKAQTILHEMIHAVTSYALYVDELPALQSVVGMSLTPEMRKAVDTLRLIFGEIKNDADFKGYYGATDVHEMVAELSNPEFRAKLREKGLWQQVVDAIKRLLGIEVNNALDGAEGALQKMLDNFDRTQWDKMVAVGRSDASMADRFVDRIEVENKKQNWENAIASITVDSQTIVPSSQALPNSATAKVQKSSDKLANIAKEISTNGVIGINGLIYGISDALGIENASSAKSDYVPFTLGNGAKVSIRVANHYGNARTFYIKGNDSRDAIGLVLKTSNSTFRDNEDVNYLEFVYYGDLVENNMERQIAIVNGLKHFVETGSLSQMPIADDVFGSGKYKPTANELKGVIKTPNTQESGEEMSDVLARPGDRYDYQKGDKITADNVNTALYAESGDYMSELHGENGISLRVRRGDGTEINVDKLNTELDRALPILEEYRDHLTSLKSKATASAQEVIDTQIAEVEDAIAWSYRVKDNPDLIKERSRPSMLSRPSDRLAEVNERFNEELEAFADGTHHGELHLGEPGEVLQASGLNASEMYITPRTLKTHLNKHGLSVDDIRNLPMALQNPLMVYEWGSKAKSLVVITQIPRGDQRITVAVKLERGGERLEVNEIASVHGKDVERVISEMNDSRSDFGKEKLKYVNKEIAKQWLGLVPPRGTASLTEAQQHATKIIENFENPTIEQENNAESGENVQTFADVAVSAGEKLGVKVVVDPTLGSKGSYNLSTGEVRVNPDAHLTEADVERTVVHEVIGHGGMQALLGERFDGVCKMVFEQMSDEQVADIRRRHGKRLSDAEVGAEYMAETAERMADPLPTLTDSPYSDAQNKGRMSIPKQLRQLWERIKGWIREAVRRRGIAVAMTDADIRYMIATASRKAKEGKLQEMIFETIKSTKGTLSSTFCCKFDRLSLFTIIA